MLAWLDNANKSLDDAPPVYGNPKQIETELSKLKVFVCLLSTLLIICFIIAYADSESIDKVLTLKFD